MGNEHSLGTVVVALTPHSPRITEVASKSFLEASYERDPDGTLNVIQKNQVVAMFPNGCWFSVWTKLGSGDVPPVDNGEEDNG